MPLLDDRLRLAKALWCVAVLALAFIPLGMAMAHRSSIFFLTLAAVLALGATLLQGEGAALVRSFVDALRSRVGLAALAFLAWAGASILWSPVPALSLFSLGELVLPLGASLVLALALPGHVPRWAVAAFAVAVVLACGMILAELATGMSARRDLGMRSQTFIFNRPALTLLVLLPALVPLVGASRMRLSWIAAGLLAALVSAAILVSDSGAATLGLLIAALGSLTLAAARPAALVGVAAGIAVVFVSAPFIGDAAARVLPEAVHSQLASSHSRERVEIWQAFGAAVREQPLIGLGFGVSPRLHKTVAVEQVAPEHKNVLAMGHSHNAPLQVWIELGAVGVLLGLIVIGLALEDLARLPTPRLVPGFALFCAVVAVALVGHGAWQGWWAAAIGAAIVWLRVVASREERAPG